MHSEKFIDHKVTKSEKVQFYIDKNSNQFNFFDDFDSIILSITEGKADIKTRSELENISEYSDEINIIKRIIDLAKNHGIDVSMAEKKLELLTPIFPGSDSEIENQDVEK